MSECEACGNNYEVDTDNLIRVIELKDIQIKTLRAKLDEAVEVIRLGYSSDLSTDWFMQSARVFLKRLEG